MTGTTPLSPAAGDPTFDMAWFCDGILFVGEVKSITSVNEERQLRLGLGQVLRYAEQLRARHQAVRAVLVAERQPADPSWLAVCDRLGVVITWPGAFQRILGAPAIGLRQHA